MPEEKRSHLVKIDKDITILVEKFDTIAKALRTYIKENSKRIETLDEKLKGLDDRASRIETTLNQINDYNVRIAKEIENSSNLVTGGFYDLKSRVEDVELNILSSMKKFEKQILDTMEKKKEE
jgi:predicted  nucleic acid-binding Zn-ribbon protein